MRHCGWAFVAIDEEGEIVASAFGVPPEWVDNIAGAEAWAMHEASSRALPGTVFKVDCKPCVDMIKAGLSVAGQGKRLLARVFWLIFTSIDDSAAECVVWMPAHTSADEVGVRKIGNGTRLTATDRFGNAEADRLLKLGVEAQRVLEQVREEVQRQADLQYDLATWLGQVATTAGNWLGGGPARDPAASRRRATAEAKAKGAHSMPRRKARKVVSQRSIDMGGHRLTKVSHKWQCTVCKMSSKYWSRIVGGQCNGSVAKKCAVKAQELGVAGAQ